MTVFLWLEDSGETLVIRKDIISGALMILGVVLMPGIVFIVLEESGHGCFPVQRLATKEFGHQGRHGSCVSPGYTGEKGCPGVEKLLTSGQHRGQRVNAGRKRHYL
jgi:hypothetical protein